MKLDSVSILNFRSIRSLDMSCRPGINVIAGVNGAGKSTLLNAIEIVLTWVKARIKNRNSSGLYPLVTDISTGSDYSLIGVKTLYPAGLEWEVTKISPSFRSKDRPKSDLVQLTEYCDKLATEYFANPESSNLPMFVKYSVNRSLIDIPVRVHKRHILDAMALYEERIDAGINLRSFFEWFREREDIEREEREERKSFEYEDPQLRVVRRAISEVMNGYGDLHTRRKAPAGFELRKNGLTFRVEELSDGEKCYLTLVGDIARRLAICNQTLRNPLDGEGIVLIDELELHLHPSWQSEAVDKLRKVFPNCQFFITTHSPHVVQNLHLDAEDSLTVLSNGMVYNVGSKYGQPVDEVLSEVFGLESLRPKPVAEASARVWKLLNMGLFEGEELNSAIRDLVELITEQDLEIARIKMQLALNKKKSRHVVD